MHSLLRRPAAALFTRGVAGGAPHVVDSIVAFTAVTQAGHRIPVLGRVGQKLSEALAASNHPELQSAVAFLSESTGPEAHVRISHEFEPVLPVVTEDDKRMMSEKARFA